MTQGKPITKSRTVSIQQLIQTHNVTPLNEWENCKFLLKELIPEPFYSHFIAPLQAFYDQKRNIILYVSSEKLLKHIEIRYDKLLKNVIHNFYRNKLPYQNIKFYRKRNHIEPKPEEISSLRHNSLSESVDIPHASSFWNYELFYPSKKNYNELTNLIQLEKYFRPIFIYGSPGTGKSSLARIWLSYHKNKVFYITISNFITEFVNSIKKRNSIEWLENIKSYPICIIDDFQFLKPTAKKCQEEIRNLIDYFRENNKIFILLSDRDFEYLKLEKDLKSRLMAFHKIHLLYPDFYTKIEIIKNHAKKYKLELNTKIIEHLAIKLNGDVRYIHSSIEKLSYYSVHPNQLKLYELDFILEPFYDKSSHVDIDTIVEVVCDHYKISRTSVLSSKKDKKTSLVRHIIAYLSVRMANYTMSYVAKYLKRKDHTGILYAIKKIEELLEKDLFLESELEIIKEKILLYRKKEEE